MKTTALAVILAALTTSLCFADPGQPELNGLTPHTGTYYANTNFYDNGGAESGGVDIAANGNVLVGWEDDGGNIYDFEGVWSVFDWDANLITPVTVQSNRSLLGAVPIYKAITNTYLSFFRSDDTAIGAYTGWGPKMKANRWGNGIGYGCSDWEMGLEIDELLPLNNAEGFDDMPAVQLLNNDGTPYRPGPITYGPDGATNLGILTMGAAVTAAGNCRISDWDYLSNGNIVLGGESRQALDRLLTGQTSGNIPTFRIVKPSGEEVVSYRAASSDNSNNNDMWHGIGVTANGFALKWNKALRMFDNNGNPTTANINLVTATGHPEAQASGDRGDNVGFHGNGKDAYAFVDKGLTNYSVVCTASHQVIITNNPGPGETYTTNTICDNLVTNVTLRLPWVTVLNTDGSVRWSRAVQDAGDPWYNHGDNEVDCAIAPDGRVVVVFTTPITNATDPSIVLDTVQAKLFSPCGTPLGGRFYVSEWENPTNSAFVTGHAKDITPRVAWRGNKLAFTFMSYNPPFAGFGIAPVMGIRNFTVTPSAPPTGLTIAKSGANVAISWSGGGTLESADNIAGPWTSIYDCSPSTQPASGGTKLYRVKGW